MADKKNGNGREVARADSQNRPTVPMGSRGLVPRDFNEMYRMATALAKSGLVPSQLRDPDKVFLAIEAGLEVGLPPVAALQNSMVIDGKHAFWGEAVMGIILQSGELEKLDEKWEGKPGTPERTAVCYMRRKNGLEKEGRFSLRQAKDARLDGKPNWKADSDAMLMWRARSRARIIFADLLKGIRIAEIEPDMQAMETPEYREVTHAGDLPDNGRQYDGPAFGEAASSTDDDPEDDVPAFTEGDRLLAELRDVIEMQDCVEGVEAFYKELKPEQVNTLVEHGLLEVLDRLVDERKEALRGAGV